LIAYFFENVWYPDWSVVLPEPMPPVNAIFSIGNSYKTIKLEIWVFQTTHYFGCHFSKVFWWGNLLYGRLNSLKSMNKQCWK
jgi:hypothetical protein